MKNLCNNVKTVRQFPYLLDRVCAGEECDAAVTARTRYAWVVFGECSELLYSRRFPLRLKGAFYKTYVRPAVLYGSEAWCLKQHKMKFCR